MQTVSTTYELSDEFTKEQYETEMDNRGKELKWFGRFNVLQNQNDEPKSKPFIVGLDTETFSSSGNLLCLNNSYDDSTLYGGATWDKLVSMQEIYQYFMNLKRKIRKEQKTDNIVFMFWNMKFDASVLLKSLKENLMSFYQGYSKEEKLRGVYDELNIEYLNKKALTLKRHKSHKKFDRVVIYDAMQFWKFSGMKGDSGLDSVAEKQLGLHKKDDEVNKIYPNKKFPDNIPPHHMKVIVQYCIDDCKLIPKLIDLWLEKFHASFGYYPQKFHSLGTVALDTLKQILDEMHSFNDIPYDIQELAYKCYYGGRFEIFQKGRVGEIFHYDINSAYPYAMSLLPNFKNGTWKEVKRIEDLDTSKVGLYRIKVKVNEQRLTPFLFRYENGSVKCPTGEFTTWTTSFELDVAMKHYDIELINVYGWEFQESKKAQFQDLVTKWYGERVAQKDEGQKYIYKVLINSLYGKFAQRKPEPKNLFNPVMASLITGKCRAMLLDSAKDNKDDIVMFATDGVFSKKPLKHLDTSGKKVLGHWDYEHHPDFKVVMAGIYSYTDDKKPEDFKVKTRGFSPKMRKLNGWEGDFIIKDDSLVFDGDKAYWTITNILPNSLVQSILHTKTKSTHDIAKFVEQQKELDLNGDNSRNWDKLITSTNDFSDSMALYIY